MELENRLSTTTISASEKQKIQESIIDEKEALARARRALLDKMSEEQSLKSLYQHLPLHQLQKDLDGETCLLLFFIGYEHKMIYTLKIDRTGVTLFKRSIPDGFRSDVIAVINSDRSSSKMTWIAANQRLSRLLIHDIFSQLTQNVIIVPDGILAYLPFEILFTAEVNGKSAYRSFPYFIKEKTISYNFSASLWHEMKNKSNSGKGLLTMAPKFSISEDNSKITPLAHAKKEVAAIQSILENQYAPKSKKEFIEDAERAQIIHFAGHAILNDRQTDNSYLAFSSDEDMEDKLFIREIYSMKTPGEMVVLSACNTGIGEIKKGEGVMSLARAFAYSGTKSLVYSLWEVNDASTKKNNGTVLSRTQIRCSKK